MAILTSKNESFCEFLNSMLSQRDVISDGRLLLWYETCSGSMHIRMDNFGPAQKICVGFPTVKFAPQANPPPRTLTNPN